MESIRYKLVIINIILFFISMGNGDVSVSRSYYSPGSVSYESLYLHDMDYKNSASIWNSNFYASGEGHTSEGSKEPSIFYNAYVVSRQGINGATLQPSGYTSIQSSNFVSGDCAVGFGYNMTAEGVPAKLQLISFNPDIRFSENISRMTNSQISGSLQSYGSSFVSTGDGKSTGNGPTVFDDTVDLQYMDMSSRTETFLKAPSQNIPINYTWASISGKGEIAKSYMRIDAYKGIISGMGIKGSSIGINSSLDDKFSPLSYKDPKQPLIRNATDSDKVVYILYLLNSSQ